MQLYRSILRFCNRIGDSRYLLSLVLVWQNRHGNPYPIRWFGDCFLTTIIALVLGRRVGLKNRVLLSEDVGQDGMKGLLHYEKS